MNTPIYDFVKAYASAAPTRFHMPGHKGRGPLGCEELDLTEIPGADSLYEASGIIAESEANASRLFGCPTFYSTEGSSQCIKAMLFLAMQAASPASRCVLAARNVHRAFLSAAALLDLDVVWLPTGAGSYLSADVTPEALAAALTETGAGAVYLTCPDYLGNLPELGPLAEVCHAHGALLLVDNAHGAYLRFLPKSRHPMDLGADLCCDSAHKTFPVLTGGAWLHLSPDAKPELRASVRDALALFGSTSPSYLILQSLDLCNPWLEALPEIMPAFLESVDALKAGLRAEGWSLYGEEPWKITLRAKARGLTGTALAALLEQKNIYAEFSDPDFVTLMLTPQNPERDFIRLREALRSVSARPPLPETPVPTGKPEQVCSLAEAMLAPCVRVPASESLGRVLARPGVSCPPAVPIRMPGERIDEAALAAFHHYGIHACEILTTGGM